MTVERHLICGVPVDGVNERLARERIESMLNDGVQGTVLAVNPEKVLAARRDPMLLKTLNDAALLLPDGIGAVWLARALFPGSPVDRVAGSDTMPLICEICAKYGHSVFLFGAAPGVAEEAAATLQERMPALTVAGVRDGFVSEGDMPELIESINLSGAAVVFVALGSPKQELWMQAHQISLKARVLQGVGGTFNVLAGRVERAPVSWQKLNLEWLYRLVREPKRIFRQSGLVKFLVLAIWEVLRLRVVGKFRRG